MGIVGTKTFYMNVAFMVKLHLKKIPFYSYFYTTELMTEWLDFSTFS